MFCFRESSGLSPGRLIPGVSTFLSYRPVYRPVMVITVFSIKKSPTLAGVRLR